MTDFNDGKWHGWNGGECPVHPFSTVEAKLFDGSQDEDIAEEWCWCGDKCCIVAFRVVKEYQEPREPREWWIVPGAPQVPAGTDLYHFKPWVGAVRVREVLDGEES